MIEGLCICESDKIHVLSQIRDNRDDRNDFEIRIVNEEDKQLQTEYTGRNPYGGKLSTLWVSADDVDDTLVHYLTCNRNKLIVFDNHGNSQVLARIHSDNERFITDVAIIGNYLFYMEFFTRQIWQ